MNEPGPLPGDLAGRTAVVTGAAQGIGEAIAKRLAACGTRVVAIDENEDALAAAFANESCIPFLGDLSRLDAGELATALLDRYGPAELIVNNVGITTNHRFLDLEEAEFDLVFRTNLRGPWFFTKRLVQELIKKGQGGSVVFISSLHHAIVRLHPHYSSSKAAALMLAREMAQELAPHGIRVNVVTPGSIRSPANPVAPEDPVGQRFVPAGYTGEPDDVAKVVIALLSDAWCGYVSGAEVRVDGGLGLHSWITDQR